MAKFLIVSFKDTLVHAYNGLQIVRGVTEEDKDDFIEAYERMNKAGRVPVEQDGLEIFALGTFDDNTGKIDVYPDGEYLVTLHANTEVSENGKK